MVGLMKEPILASDITYDKYKDQYENYQYAHNGYGQYLSYELAGAEAKIKDLERKLATVAKGLCLESYELDDGGFWGRACSRLQFKNKILEKIVSRLEGKISLAKKGLKEAEVENDNAERWNQPVSLVIIETLRKLDEKE